MVSQSSFQWGCTVKWNIQAWDLCRQTGCSKGPKTDSYQDVCNNDMCNLTFIIYVLNGITLICTAKINEASFTYLTSIKQNNNVHIGNHLYSENQRKRGKETQQWYFKTVCQPGNSPYNSLQKNPDDCQIFFAILLHILLKTWKRKKKKIWIVGSFIDLLDFDLLPLNIQDCTFSSQGGRVDNNALCSTWIQLWIQFPR